MEFGLGLSMFRCTYWCFYFFNFEAKKIQPGFVVVEAATVVFFSLQYEYYCNMNAGFSVFYCSKAY
jgi:hypothetical protein